MRSSSEDEAFAARAHEETFRLQHGERGEHALWQHILRVSVEDLKRNYDNLGVSFDVWLGESDAQKYIPQMLETVKAKGLCVESEGALVVPVQEETDAKEVPPCILVKSDGATLYATTDLATIVQREQDYHPKKYMYLTDKRQNLHFEQIFRVAKKAGLVGPETALGHIGFGTMNGKDGKPFKMCIRDSFCSLVRGRRMIFLAMKLPFCLKKGRSAKTAPVRPDFQLGGSVQAYAAVGVKYAV